MARITLPSLATLATLAALTAGVSGCSSQAERAGETVRAEVEEVVDGDTIDVLLDGESVPVRYIGIDTPESGWPADRPEPFSRRATEENRRLVEGRTVRLLIGEEPFDRYDRLLAYVFVGDTMVNARLVEAGLAETLTIPPNDRFADRFTQLEDRARAARVGIWEAG